MVIVLQSRTTVNGGRRQVSARELPARRCDVGRHPLTCCVPPFGLHRSHRDPTTRTFLKPHALNRQIPWIFGEVCAWQGVATGEEPSPCLGTCSRLPGGLFEACTQLVQERRSLAVRDHLELGGDGGVHELAPAARGG